MLTARPVYLLASARAIAELSVACWSIDFLRAECCAALHITDKADP